MKLGRLGIALAAAVTLYVVASSMTSQSIGASSPQGASGSASSLDFQVYRTRIEPIFLKQREGGVMCYNCHSILSTRLRLQPMSPGSTSWTEDQSRQNFGAVSQLVTPGDPSHSRLLLHPLAPDAGGDPFHTGGKFWKSQNDPEWQMIAEWVRSGTAGAPVGQVAAPSMAAQPLDFEFFKTQVEPIFLKKRATHARCYSCHAESNTNFRLEKLSPGSTFWTEEQSRRNFQAASQLVVPGDPTSSRFLMHPLAPEAGGDPFHDGGRQFETQNDPDWEIMAAWVRGAKAGTQ
jgi:hypothetical protein